MKKNFILFMITCILFLGQVPSVFAEEQHVQEEVIYKILIDRYSNGDHTIDEQVNIDDPFAYHGGDLQGIIDRLDDISELGITTISLSPIFANVDNGYHGYWIDDFYEIEEQFGTLDDFRLLVEEAHNRDMKVVVELVTNYISSTHPIVNDPDKADWVIENDLNDPDWLTNVATLNLENNEVQDFIIEVADYWIKETGIDGYQLHAVDQTPIDFLQQLTERIKENHPNFYLFGNILVSDDNKEEILETTQMDAIDYQELSKAMVDTFSEEDNGVSVIHEVWDENVEQQSLLYVDDMYSKRFTQAFSENGRNSLTTWKLALTYMYTAPGIPIIYQGSEIPMYGGNQEEAQQLVEFNSGDSDLQEYFHKVFSLRSQFSALQFGDYELVGSSNAMSVFRRSYEGETLYIAINNSSESQDVTVSDIDSGMQLRGYLGDNLVRENENGEYRIGLARETAEVYVVQPDSGLNWGFISFVVGVMFVFVFGVIYLSRKQKRDEDRG